VRERDIALALIAAARAQQAAPDPNSIMLAELSRRRRKKKWRHKDLFPNSGGDWDYDFGRRRGRRRAGPGDFYKPPGKFPTPLCAVLCIPTVRREA
jgi:hypothetical protein